MKSRQHNHQKRMKGQTKVLQNLKQKIEAPATRTPLQTTVGEHMCSGRVISSCLTWGTRRVAQTP